MTPDNKTFVFTAWIHPKEGGDDFKATGTVIAPTIEEARARLEEWLAVRSAVTNDYAVKPQEGAPCTA